MADVAASEYARRFREATGHADAGDLGAAERLLLRVLDEFPDERRRTLSALGAVYARAGRMFESLAISRHLAEAARRADDRVGEFRALAGICTALYGLYIHAERREIVARLDALIAELPDAEFPWCHLEHAYCRLGQALDDGDFAGARVHVRRLEELAPTETEANQRLLACVTLANHAIIELREGDPDRALEFLNELELSGAADAHHAPELTVLRVRVQVARGALEDARGDAERAAEALAAATPFALSDCVCFGTQLARILEQDLDDPDAALRVYDIAATAVVRRITQLDACMRALPDLHLGGVHEKELVRYRLQFREGQRKLLDRVGALLRAREAAGMREILDRAKKEDLVAICAWCESIRAADGSWMPFGHFLPRDGTYQITATICKPCRAVLR